VTEIDGPPSELSRSSRALMNVRGPRNLTDSMSGCIEVFAPVFESKVKELNLIPMYGLASPNRRSSKFVRSPWIEYVVWLGLAIGV
jgi:hypothetical protein